MDHSVSAEDQDFRQAFEALEVTVEEFNHRAHVRLAYIYLCEMPVDEASQAMKRALLAFLDHLGAEATKYHETITRAWIKAVRHFMANTAACGCAGDFIDLNPKLLDTKIMLSHYSAEVLFSPKARGRYVDPDIDPIPDH
jgi:hexokinase